MPGREITPAIVRMCLGRWASGAGARVCGGSPATVAGPLAWKWPLKIDGVVDSVNREEGPMATVAWIGLGAMGSRMAVRLVDAGHEVIVWNLPPTGHPRLSGRIRRGCRNRPVLRPSRRSDGPPRPVVLTHRHRTRIPLRGRPPRRRHHPDRCLERSPRVNRSAADCSML
jgi:hypothetical protein